MLQQILAIWSLVPLPFLNPAWTSGSSPFTYSWSLAWRILSVTLLACEMSAIYGVEHSLALPFSGIGMKTDLFQSCGNCWVFRICWHTEYSTLAAASFFNGHWLGDFNHLEIQSNEQNSPSQASTVRELWTSRCSSWIWERQRNQRSNCQHLLHHGKSKRVPENIYFCFIDYAKAFDCGSQ